MVSRVVLCWAISTLIGLARLEVIRAGVHDLKVPPLGPHANESGRYIYKVLGTTLYCTFCEQKALSDSTFLYMLQTECYPPESQNFTPHEVERNEFAICSTGRTPGCGKPPAPGNPNLFWKCNTGYSGKLYSMYTSCQLICNVTQTVTSQIYCNETEVWHTDFIEDVNCEATVPTVRTPTDSNWIIWIVVAAGVVLFACAAVILVWCCLCKKRTSRYNQPENPMSSPIGDTIGMKSMGNSFKSIGPCSLVNEPGMTNIDERNNNKDDGKPYGIDNIDAPPVDDAPDTDGGNCGEPDDNDRAENGDNAEEEDSDETSKLLPAYKEASKTEHRERPDIRVFHSDMSDSCYGNLESRQLQENMYSVPRGSSFYIVPSSPQGIAVTDFVVTRKGQGRPYRGTTCPELNLDFFHIVNNADEEDAGRYIGHITLENGEHFQREFQIFVAHGENTSDEVPEIPEAPEVPDATEVPEAPEFPEDSEVLEDMVVPEDMEVSDHPASLPNVSTDRANADIKEQYIVHESGEVSEGNKMIRRPEPEGAEIQSFVQSGKPGQQGQKAGNPMAQIVAFRNAAQQQNSPQNTGEAGAQSGQNAVAQNAAFKNKVQQQSLPQDRDGDNSQSVQEQSVPHLNIGSLAPGNSQSFQEQSVPHLNIGSLSSGNSQQGRRVPNNHNQNNGANVNNDIRNDAGSISLRFSTLGSNHDVSGRILSGGNINGGHSSVRGEVIQQNSYDNRNNQGSDRISNNVQLINNPIYNPLENVPRLNPNSVSSPSNERGDPSGISVDIPFSEIERENEDRLLSVEDNCQVHCRENNDVRDQTAIKEVAPAPVRCCANLEDLRDLVYLEQLYNMADPRDRYGNRRSWFGFGQHYGLPAHLLYAVEYHRRGFLDDGPMRAVLRELGTRQVYDMVRYFLENDRMDIVNLTLDDCADHRRCRACILARQQYRQRNR